MNYKEFFGTNNKSGWKCREDRLKSNFPEIHNEIICFITNNECLKELPFKTKIWHFINNVTNIPICLNCGKLLKFGRSLEEGYPIYCSIKCTNKNINHINKIKETNLNNHGVSCSLQIPEVILKSENTMMEEYGVTNYFYLKDKIKEDCLNKLGVDHPMKLKTNISKRDDTNIIKYNVKNLVELDRVRDVGFKFKKDVFLKKYLHLEILNVVNNKIIINCLKCGQKYEISRDVLYYRNKYNIEPCIICNPISSGVSYHEKEIASFIKDELNLSIIENDRKIIKPYEIDILLPEKRIGIEFNGLYWHSDAKIVNNYHQIKTNLGIENNIQIIHVFQDEWIFKRDIIKSMIKAKVGIFDKKINIDDCEIKIISEKLKTVFLNDNHVDGDCGSNCNIGVFYEKELILVCTLMKNNNIIEILRFCHKLNYMTTYAFKKILYYIKNEFNPKIINTIVDLRYSNGNLFEKYGFKKSSSIPPDYWLVDDMFRMDKNQFIGETNLPKIYDCGKLKYQLIC